MNVKKCTAYNIKIDEDNYEKDRNICKNCYMTNRKNYNNKEKKRKVDDSVKIMDNVNITNNDIVSAYENHRHVVIGPSNVGKTY